jgi:DNA-directed RNA polymerase III subunit RPC4
VPATPSQSDHGRGRGRGRGTDGRGRGAGAPSRVAADMTASGPFALGPAMAGVSGRRAPPRSNFSPIEPPVPGSSSSTLGSGLSRSAAPSIKKYTGDEAKKNAVKDVDIEEYSDPDEGVEIIDMDDVRKMDWMAPESLGREKQAKKSRTKEENVAPSVDLKGKGKGRIISVYPS